MSLGALLIMVIAFAAIFDSLSRSRQRGAGQGGPPRPPGDGARGGARDGVPGDAHADMPGTQVRLPRPGLPRAEESAQILLPDDLWAILTGETRPSAPRPPLPAPDVDPEEEWEAEEFEEYDQLPTSDHGRSPLETVERARAEAHELTTMTGEPLELRSREGRELVVRKAREIISHDDEIPTDRERHDAFHRRLDATAGGAGPSVTVAERHAARRRQLQRAIILREVLGPPRGLEDRH